MKKLRLYGWKLNTKNPARGRVIASVYVQSGVVAIDAETPQLEKELHNAIDPGAYGRGFRLETVPHQSAVFQTANDSQFLDAVIRQNGLWIGKTYDGWTIDEVKSEISDD